MKPYNFLKVNDEWYIDLPEYLRLGGNQEDLQMVAGADTMLDSYSGSADRVTLLLDVHPFDKSDILNLKQIGTKADGGGAFYEMVLKNGHPISQIIWLCDVLIFVFGTIPDKIYVQKASKIIFI